MRNLIEIKNLLDKKKTERDRLAGQKTMLEESLKKLGYNSVEDATTALNKLSKDIEDRDTLLQQDLEEFEKIYGELLQ